MSQCRALNELMQQTLLAQPHLSASTCKQTHASVTSALVMVCEVCCCITGGLVEICMEWTCIHENWLTFVHPLKWGMEDKSPSLISLLCTVPLHWQM